MPAGPDTLKFSAECISYWIMCDGSVAKDKQTMIIHTQSFNF